MTGIIVTGHGKFPDGLTSAVELIAGPQEAWVSVPFENETEQLQQDLDKALEELKDADGILIFTDLAGGSPFKTIVEKTAGRDDVEIMAGTNLPMLVELAMARKMGFTVADLANMAENTGKDQAFRFKMDMLAQDDEPDGDGI